MRRAAHPRACPCPRSSLSLVCAPQSGVSKSQRKASALLGRSAARTISALQTPERMHVLTFTRVALACSVLAGRIGALAGLVGGVILLPMLTLGLGVDIRYAIGASLV